MMVAQNKGSKKILLKTMAGMVT